jgi:hypothetical protein
MAASFAEFDVVVLLRDLPEAGLLAGNLGAVVQVYAPDALEVEFVDASGMTLAVETLSAGDVRPVRAGEILAMRAASHPAD